MTTLVSRLPRILEWIAPATGSPIEAWRRRSLAVVLLGVTVLGSFAYVVGATAAYRTDVIAVVVIDTVVYGLVVAVTVLRRLPYRLRAGVVTALPGVLGAFFLYNFGFVAAGFPWVTAFPIVAGILLGLRAGLTAWGILAAMLLGIGLLIPANVMPWTQATPDASVLWWVSSSSVLMLSGLLALATGYLFDGLGREAEARAAAVQESERRERLASLGTLTGGIAHDFNNLLQPIVSDAEHARRLLDEHHAANPLLADILVSAHRARTLVRRILSFARPAVAGEREVVNLGNLILESARLLRAVVPANVQLVPDVDDDVFVLAEAGEIQQVLFNLVTNSAHAMPRGGTVTVAVRGTDSAILTVHDTGSGMSGETLARAFEPFYTTKQPGHGTGLGLATVYTTITALGGTVQAESQTGEGTRILVRLPRVQPAASDSPTFTRATPAPGASTCTHVVIVDDEPMVLQATSRLIERLGYQVTTFDAPQTLLDRFETIEPAPQLVLTDLSMPGMSGWELAALLHQRVPTVPIIVMTGNLDLADDTPAGGTPRRKAGVKDILSKPFTSAELRSALERSLS